MRRIELDYQAKKFTEKLQRKVAWALPRSIVMWAYIRVVANATTGNYGNTIVPDLTAMEALERWDNDKRPQIHPNLVPAHNAIKWSKRLEKKQTYERIIEWSRLPKTIKHGGKEYQLSFGDIDESVYLSYVDQSLLSGVKGRVFMHYDESTLHDCISKAWRKIAMEGVKL